TAAVAAGLALVGLVLLWSVLEPAPSAQASVTGGIAYDVAVADSHAFVAAGVHGLRIVDVSTPARPREVGSYDVPESASGVVVSGRRAFVFAGGALYVIDVSDPTRPRGLGVLAALGPALGAAVGDGHLFVAGGELASAGNRGLHVVDVSDPARPRKLETLTVFGPPTSSVARAGNRLYFTAATTSNASAPTQLVVANASAAPALTFAGALPLAGIGADLDVRDGVAYVAAGGGGLRIVSLADAARPVELSAATTSGCARQVAVAGPRAYVVAGSSLDVVDVSNPAQPKPIGSTATSPRVGALAAQGAHLFLAAGTDGLQVLDVSTPTQPRLVGTYLPGR
ncbi:MAG: hypothetical protein HY329_03660, partial [Chloroflexi bacterium]|nr:hypothetical protein [Chloroflexota bacterium]